MAQSVTATNPNSAPGLPNTEQAESDEGEVTLQLLVCEIDVQPGFKLHPNLSV